MKKIIFLSVFFILSLMLIFSQSPSYELGTVQSSKGTVNADYIKSSVTYNPDYIRIAIFKEKIYANLYLPADLTESRKFIDKFAEWHKIAVDNKWDLNKIIGSVKEVRFEFATNAGKYELVLINNKSGSNITSFTLEQSKEFKELISDARIDDVLNKEKRRKEKEDALFK